MAARLTGKAQPRLHTPPLRTLTRRTSLGYELAEFAELIGEPFIPWQRWLGIHLLELNPDRSLRFRVGTVIVGRQCGKSSFARVLALYWLYVRQARLVLATAQDLSLARENQRSCIDTIGSSAFLAAELAEVRRASGDEWFRVGGDLEYADQPGDESFTLAAGGRFKVSATSRKAGRGLSVDLLWLDEVRELVNFQAWAALSATTLAKSDSLILATSNAGDNRSVVLDQLRESALSGRDRTVFLAEWSAEPDAELWDEQAWRQSLPGLGYMLTRESVATLISTTPPAEARTELLCQKVDSLNAAVDGQAWDACHDPAGNLLGHRDRVAACFDMSPDGEHATLAVAAQVADGKVRVEVAGAWRSSEDARAELPGLLARIRPRAVSWFPSGPAGAVASILRPRPGTEPPPLERARPGMPAYVEFTGMHTAQVCMEFADLVRSRQVVHAGDEVLDAHVRGAERLVSGDGWRITRKGGGHCDGAYAAAGAVSLALQIPAAKRARIRMFSQAG